MSEVFDAMLRRIGNSMGVIIPKEIIETLGCRRGDTIHISVTSSDIGSRNRKIREMAGVYRGKKEFEREKGDRY